MAKSIQVSRKTLAADARDAVDHCAGMTIRAAARRITRFLEAGIKDAGLNMAQFTLMTHIAAAGDDTIGALAARLDLDQSTLSRNLRALEKAGLIEIAIVEKDLRRRAVWLTESGASRLEAAIAAWKRAHSSLAAIIDLEDVRKVADWSAMLSAGSGP